jgi:hypothetical protein
MQVHWDIGAEVGVMQRLVTDAGPGARSPGPGPVGEVHAHVALIPMLRAGPYLAHDISPVSGMPAREMTEAGLRVKFLPPLLSAPWRAWMFVGVGYARTYTPSHHVEVASPGTMFSTDVFVAGAGGGILDVPVGFGLGYRPHRPWELFAELRGGIGVLFTGSMYSDTQPFCTCPVAPHGGKDSFALSLSVGVSFDP